MQNTLPPGTLRTGPSQVQISRVSGNQNPHLVTVVNLTKQARGVDPGRSGSVAVDHLRINQPWILQTDRNLLRATRAVAYTELVIAEIPATLPSARSPACKYCTQEGGLTGTWLPL